MIEFNGLGMNLGNLSRLSSAKSYSISAENPTGEKGKGGMSIPSESTNPARELGQGWKVTPCAMIKPGETYTLANIAGAGAIQSMWFAGFVGRDFILRIYWDNQNTPSVECPLPDFFGLPWVSNDHFGTTGPLILLNSLPVCVNPNKGLNCFWEMPFRSSCKITIENLNPTQEKMCFHQINYTITEVPDNVAYFHAQYRRENPVSYGTDYTIIDGIKGRGHYIGTVMGVGVNNNGWWGEGEIKFFIDNDDKFPTICGTGTEDYFGGSFNWDAEGQYRTYSTPYCGMHQVIHPDGVYSANHRHAMYRWHIMDPIRFEENLKVTIQDLGWRSEGRYLPRQDDICSVAFWYQTLPTNPFPKLPDRDYLEII